MENSSIQEFYETLEEMIKEYTASVDNKYSIDTINNNIKNIPLIINGFKEDNNEKNYKISSKKQDKDIATIQLFDSGTRYEIINKDINLDEYKALYYELLMYSLVEYQLFFEGYKYKIVSDSDDQSKCTDFEIKIEQLLYFLGLDKILKNNSEVFEKNISGYKDQDIIGKLLSIIFNYHIIIDFELQNGVEIINYYKSMRKLKEFLICGKIFYKFQPDDSEEKALLVVDKNDTSNQLYLLKKNNSKLDAKEDIRKIIIQKAELDTFYARIMQSIFDKINEYESAMEQLRNSSITLTDLPEDVVEELKNNQLVFDKSVAKKEYKIDIDNKEVLINPFLFSFNTFNLPVVDYDELMGFINKIKNKVL